MGISGRIARFFQASQLTPLLALVAFLMGLFAVAVTPREEEPQINVTMANVLVPFPGASARDRDGRRGRSSDRATDSGRSRSRPHAACCSGTGAKSL